MSGLRVFVNTKFDGHSPVGVAAVVFAEDAKEAAEQLIGELHTVGLPQTVDPADMVEICPNGPTAYVLCDGNY
jgi:hypothetical protein